MFKTRTEINTKYMSIANFARYVGVTIIISFILSLFYSAQLHAVSITNQEYYNLATPGAGPTQLVTAPDGTVWFGENNSSKISKITSSGAITSYTVPSYSYYGACVRQLTVGPDGNIWFVDANTDQIGRITNSGAITKFAAPLPNQNQLGGLFDITFGADGNIWFTLGYTNKIGKMTTNGSWQTYQLPNGDSWPSTIATGSDGALWYTLNGGKIGRVTTSGQITTYQSIYPESTFSNITRAAGNELWFTDLSTGKIGKISTSGDFTFYTPPSANISWAYEIIPGPDGAMWFVSQMGEKEYIGRVTGSGEFTEYSFSFVSSPENPGSPWSLTFDHEGNLWVSLFGRNQILKMTLMIVEPPTNLSAASPVRYPSLQWLGPDDGVYKIYRDSALIATTTSKHYIDSTAPEGSHMYEVSAVQGSTESGHSNPVTVIVDRTRPSVTITSPTELSGTFTTGPTVTIYASDISTSLSKMVIHLYASSGQLLGVCGSASSAQLLSGVMSCNLGGVAAGSYYIKAGANDQASNNKTVISDLFTIEP